MKIKPLALLLSALFLALAPRAARADEEVSFQFFYDTLSPLGEWVQVGDYGDCWHPTGVDEDWAPYTDGYWSYTDAGWTWVSYEDWGGITYHYGRWVRTDEEGWCWVPDYEWGPAWVSWRNNEEAVGWAPLPPEAHWRASVGISTWCDDTYDIGPGYYTFCPIVEFGAPLIRSVCYPRSRNVFFIGNTINCTNISFNSYHNVVFCGGPNFTYINERCHRHIPSLKLVIGGGDWHRDGRGGRGWTNARNVGNTLQVYAPKIVNNNTTIINKPKITKVINKTQVNKGWNLVKDQGERQKIRTQIKEQNKGLTADNSPARPVKAEDLKVLPEKADPKAPSPVAITNRGGGRDRNGDGIPDNRKGNIGAGNVPNAGRDRNGDGVPDNQPGNPGNGKGPKVVGKDQNGDGIPDGQQGQGAGGKVPKMVGKDQNGDGIPDAQPGKTGPGNGPKGVGRDQNGDGVPDNQKGNVVPGNGQKPGGKDLNGDGIPDRRGSGGFVPPGKTGNGDVDQPGKHNDAQQQQEQAARRQETLERQRERQAQIQEQQQQKRQNQAEQQQKQQNQAEQQQRALQIQRNQQVQRQQEMQRQRQELQRGGGQNEIQRQPQVQRERPQQPQQNVQRQPVPQRQPQPQPQPNNGGGGQGKGKNQQATDDDGQKKKHN